MILVYAPEHDASLRNAAFIAALHLRTFEGLSPVDVSGPACTVDALWLKLGGVQGVVFCTHGSSCSIVLNREAAIVAKDLTAFRGKWIHAIACLTAEGSLPEEAIQVGVTCYAGYDAKLIVEWDVVPPEAEELFSKIVTYTTQALAAGVRDEKSIKRGLSPLVDDMMRWRDANPESGYAIEILAQQMVGRLRVCCAA
jgi:hypothetical protein